MKRWMKIMLAVVVVLVIVRLLLPHLVLRYANKQLAAIDGYYGHIEDIDIALFRGAYRIDSIYLNTRDTVTQKQSPFFSARAIDLSVEWKALFHGSIVGELIFERPVITFTKDKVEPADVKKDSSDFNDLLDDLMPLQVNRFEINNGQLRYRDLTTKPRVDVSMTDMRVVALNLRNSYDSSSLLPAKVMARANVYEGTFEMNVNLNPWAERPTFDLNADLKNTNLVLLNDFFKAYAKIDVNKGTFGMYTEVASKQGRFTGYVKPIIKDLDVLGEEDRDDNLFRKLWEAVMGGAGKLLENKPNDQVATKIPFEGDLNQPDTDVWTTVVNVLQNAFVRAIQPAIDNEINIASVGAEGKEKKGGLLKRLFDKDDAEEQEATGNDNAVSKRESREQRRAERKKAREERRQERKEKSGR